MKNTTYKGNYLVTEPLPLNLQSQWSRVNTLGKASMIVIDGGVSEGKSTLAVHCTEILQGKRIDYKRQYAMGGDMFLEKLQICADSGIKVVIYDESGDFASTGALTKFNKTLNRVFETYRAFKIIVILVLPNFKFLDNKILVNKIPRLLLHCKRRTKNYGNFDAYPLYRMFYIKSKMEKFIVPEDAYTHTEPLFRGHFKNLDEERATELHNISIQGKKNIVSEAILHNKNLMTYKQMAGKCQKSEVWIRKQVALIKAKPSQVYKRKNYYSQETLERIMRNI